MSGRHWPRWAQAGALALALVCAGWLLLTRGAAHGPAPGALGSAGTLARSLEGTEVDGGLRFFAHLPAAETVTSADLPNGALRRMFEYHLSTIGEVDEARALANIEQEIHKHLKGAHARAALALLGQYVAYKRALGDAESELEKTGQASSLRAGAARQRLDAMRKLRAQFFDARQHQDMFGAEEAYDSAALAQMDILQNNQLSAAEKAERLGAAKAAMPPELQADFDAPRQVHTLQSRAEALRLQGASDDEVYRMRAQAVGPEAAARLAEVDREETAWRQRIGQYQAERQGILQAAASTAHKQEAVQQLRARLFAPHEWPRLLAYEQ